MPELWQERWQEKRQAMKQDKELIIAKLELVAAKAKQLKLEYEQGRLWEGDLNDGVREICGEATALSELTSYDKR